MTMSLAQRVALYREAEKTLDRRRSDLYDAIRKVHAGGEPLRALARETGLSFARIHQIVKSDA